MFSTTGVKDEPVLQREGCRLNAQYAVFYTFIRRGQRRLRVAAASRKHVLAPTNGCLLGFRPCMHPLKQYCEEANTSRFTVQVISRTARTSELDFVIPAKWRTVQRGNRPSLAAAMCGEPSGGGTAPACWHHGSCLVVLSYEALSDGLVEPKR
jgi:hypothetical protein